MVLEEKRIRVFLLTESRLLGEALAKVLKRGGDLNVVGATCHSEHVTEEIVAAQPDILLADTAVTKSGSIQIIPGARKLLPALKVLLVGMESDKELFLRAVKSGVSGYVLKDASSVEVGLAIRRIGREAVCPASLCSALFEYIAQERARTPQCQVISQGKHPLGLTRREQQVVEMIGRGLTNKEIASLLNLSEQTVKNHVHRMLRKVGATDRMAVADLCRNSGEFGSEPAA